MKLFTRPLFKTSVIVLTMYCVMQFVAAFYWPGLNERVLGFLLKTNATALEAYYVVFGVFYVVFFMLGAPRAISDMQNSKLDGNNTDEASDYTGDGGSYSVRRAQRKRTRRASRRRI
jgi:hypothetical protein